MTDLTTKQIVEAMVRGLKENAKRFAVSRKPEKTRSAIKAPSASPKKVRRRK